MSAQPNQLQPRSSSSIQRRLLLGVLAILLLALGGQAVMGEYYRNEMWQREFEDRCQRTLAGLRMRLPRELFRRIAEQRRQGQTVAPTQILPIGGEEGLAVDGLAYYRMDVEMGDTHFLLTSHPSAPPLSDERSLRSTEFATITAGTISRDGRELPIHVYRLIPPRPRFGDHRGSGVNPRRDSTRRETPHQAHRDEPEELEQELPDKTQPAPPERESDRARRGKREEFRRRIARRLPRVREMVLWFDASELEERRTQYRLAAVAITGGVLLVTSLLVVGLVRNSLRGVRNLCRDIETLDANRLSPLSPEALPAELLGVVETLNDAIARLDESYRREKAFSDNVAHELRTPIAVVCNEAELALRKPREQAGYQQSLQHILASARLQQGLVEKLLHLSRLERGRISLMSSPVDLAEQARRNLDDALAIAGREDLTIETQLEPANVETDLVFLAQAIGNLLDNALAYAAPDSAVRVCTAREGERFVFTVANVATGLSEADLCRLTQRFWRKDVARSEAAVHAGLGLTLVEQLVGCLGGTLRFDLDGETQTLTARIELPAAKKL